MSTFPLAADDAPAHHDPLGATALDRVRDRPQSIDQVPAIPGVYGPTSRPTLAAILPLIDGAELMAGRTTPARPDPAVRR